MICNRLRLAALLLALSLLSVAGAACNLPGTRANEVNRAGLVVQLSADQVVTRCIEFTEPEITGYDLLERSDLAVIFAASGGQGTAVCKIEEAGCAAEQCFCDPPNFWGYWLLVDDQWTFASVGINTRSIRNGDVDGWLWGAGTAGSATLPATTFEQICASAPVSQTVPIYLPFIRG